MTDLDLTRAGRAWHYKHADASAEELLRELVLITARAGLVGSWDLATISFERECPPEATSLESLETPLPATIVAQGPISRARRASVATGSLDEARPISESSEDVISSAMSILGKRGRGEAKRRSPEQYAAMAKRSAEVRHKS